MPAHSPPLIFPWKLGKNPLDGVSLRAETGLVRFSALCSSYQEEECSLFSLALLPLRSLLCDAPRLELRPFLSWAASDVLPVPLIVLVYFLPSPSCC